MPQKGIHKVVPKLASIPNRAPILNRTLQKCIGRAHTNREIAVDSDTDLESDTRTLNLTEAADSDSDTESDNVNKSGNRATGMNLAIGLRGRFWLHTNNRAKHSNLTKLRKYTVATMFANRECQIHKKNRFKTCRLLSDSSRNQIRPGANTIGPDLNNHSHFMLTGRRGNESGNLAIGIQIVRFTIKSLV